MANTRDGMFIQALIDFMIELHKICPTITLPEDLDLSLDEGKQILARMRELTKNWEKVRI